MKMDYFCLFDNIIDVDVDFNFKFDVVVDLNIIIILKKNVL